MDVGVEVIYNEKIHEVIHIYETGFMEIKEKCNGDLKPVILVNGLEVEKLSKRLMFE